MPQTRAVGTAGTRAPRRLTVLPAALLAVLGVGCSVGPGEDAAPGRSSAAAPSSSPTAAPRSPAPSSPPPSPAPAPAAPLRWTPCEQGFDCAVLPVPLDEADPSRGTVDLALTRRPAEDPDRRTGSLLVNPGGPGASAVEFLQAAWEGVPPAVRARFDLVAFDPRGVGRSAPVRCGSTAELDRWFALDPVPDDAAELDALEAGGERLVAGCAQRAGGLLEHLSTAQAAADLERVRAAVGDDRLTYLGWSYGTAIGAAYLDRFPTRVRAMVLDGALDPALTWDALLAGQARGFERAFSAFLADCARVRCAYRRQVAGDLGAAFDRLAARVDRAPLRGSGDRRLGPGELALGVGAALYSSASWPTLASALAAAERGDGGPLLALSDSYLSRGPEGYANTNEANLAVNCVDRPWPRERAPYVALAERVAADAPRFGPAIVLSGLACASWPVPPQGAPARVAGEGAPPVVVVGTTGDPATPYAWSVALAGQLRSGVLLTVQGQGHTAYRTGASPCLVDAVDAYLVEGRAPAARTC